MAFTSFLFARSSLLAQIFIVRILQNQALTREIVRVKRGNSVLQREKYSPKLVVFAKHFVSCKLSCTLVPTNFFPIACALMRNSKPALVTFKLSVSTRGDRHRPNMWHQNRDHPMWRWTVFSEKKAKYCLLLNPILFLLSVINEFLKKSYIQRRVPRPGLPHPTILEKHFRHFTQVRYLLVENFIQKV